MSHPSPETHADFKLCTVEEAELAAAKERLVDVYFSAYVDQPEYAYKTRREVLDYLDWLYRGDPVGFSVVRLEGEPVAWSSAHDSWRGWRGELSEPAGELQELVIGKAFQRKGLGQLLLDRATSHVSSAGRSSLGLWVGEHNEGAKALYARNRFVEDSRWRIWIRMVRPLNPTSDR